MTSNAQIDAMFNNFSKGIKPAAKPEVKATVTEIASRMVRKFRGVIEGVEYTDPSLFAEAAKTWRGPNTQPRKDLGMYITTGQNSGLIKTALGRWKTPTAKAFTERQGLEVGAPITLCVAGEYVEGQVWSEAPENGVWVATAKQEFLWVSKRDQGYVRNEQFRPVRGEVAIAS